MQFIKTLRYFRNKDALLGMNALTFIANDQLEIHLSGLK